MTTLLQLNYLQEKQECKCSGKIAEIIPILFLPTHDTDYYGNPTFESLMLPLKRILIKNHTKANCFTNTQSRRHPRFRFCFSKKTLPCG
jgi:hypothetical protein